MSFKYKSTKYVCDIIVKMPGGKEWCDTGL